MGLEEGGLGARMGPRPSQAPGENEWVIGTALGIGQAFSQPRPCSPSPPPGQIPALALCLARGP